MMMIYISANRRQICLELTHHTAEPSLSVTSQWISHSAGCIMCTLKPGAQRVKEFSLAYLWSDLLSIFGQICYLSLIRFVIYLWSDLLSIFGQICYIWLFRRSSSWRISWRRISRVLQLKCSAVWQIPCSKWWWRSQHWERRWRRWRMRVRDKKRYCKSKSAKSTTVSFIASFLRSPIWKENLMNLGSIVLPPELHKSVFMLNFFWIFIDQLTKYKLLEHHEHHQFMF